MQSTSEASVIVNRAKSDSDVRSLLVAAGRRRWFHPQSTKKISILGHFSSSILSAPLLLPRNFDDTLKATRGIYDLNTQSFHPIADSIRLILYASTLAPTLPAPLH
ncbi:hypothetical protein V496_05675 [Pseudogymnoascus sp. VKM F-4515 (FW-2607)]|nr:hypothetical protein V496_05675 [Pseudogymnoascus sp. VKM F-4515 (FW-2607)]